jgi:type II secretory pathway component GspD/PulD (secretin)
MRTLPILLLLLGACTSPAPKAEIQPPSSTATFQVIPLQYSSADELSRTLQALFGRNPDVRVMCDPRTNSLLVAASAEDVERIESLVRRPDVEVKPAR